MESEKSLHEEIRHLKSENHELLQRLKILEQDTKELDRKTYNLFILYQASRALGSMLDMEELLQLSLDMTTEVMGVEWGALYLIDEEHERLALRKMKAIESRHYPTTLSAGEGFMEWATGKIEILQYDKITPGMQILKAFPEIENLRPLYPSLIVPLFHKVRFVGLLVLGSKVDGQPFSENDMELLNTISSLAANAFMNAHLYEMAIRDGTTKLFVPRYFRQRLKEELKRAKRYSKPLTLIMMDIDNFKLVNDTWGHPHGDKVLAQISAIIRRCCREEIDIPCRYGGEEFALVVPETDPEGAYYVAERIRKNIEAGEFLKEGTLLTITISAGIASFPIHAETMEELVERADVALYESKKLGKNKVTVHRESSLKGVTK